MSLEKRRAGVLFLAILTGLSLVRVSTVAASAGPSSTAATASPDAASPAPTPDPTPQALDTTTTPASPAPPASVGLDAATATSSSRGLWAFVVPAGHVVSAYGLMRRTGREAIASGPATALQVRVDGRPEFVVTNARSVGDLVRALGLRLGAGDSLRPAASARIRSDLRVRIRRVQRTRQVVEVALPYGTLVRYSSDLMVGETEVNRSGSNGVGRETVVATYRNGRLISREVVAVQVIVAPVDQILYKGSAKTPPTSKTGIASWYGCSGYHAASPWLPFGTTVTVTDLSNGRSVTVVINDRGPYGAGRILDLCSPAFAAIAPLSQGVAKVQITW
jgi:hypothetical protein